MPKVAKPKAARAAGKASNSSSLRLYFGAAVIGLAAFAAAAALRGSFATQKLSEYPTSEAYKHPSDRLGAPSPGESAVAADCASIRHLFSALHGDEKASCSEFLHTYWERRPLLSRPGKAWAQSVMGLEDIRKMVGSWPVRFFKNHATAALHKPNSGFLADFRWQRGQEVPVDIVDVALAEQRTLVMHNLEVYWPPVGQLIRSVVRFFHAYTQVNMYMSPSDLPVATAPHQDAHSVFIVQVHGAKRWCVHRPPSAWTLKAMQRGKNGDVIAPHDASGSMGELLLNVTLRPGDVLYIPRSFFHHTATSPAVLSAEDVGGIPRADAPAAAAAGSDGGAEGGGAEGGGAEDAALGGVPSMALTVSVLSEDVYSSWLYLLGEAVQEALPEAPGAGADTGAAGRPAQAAAVVRALRRVARRPAPAGDSSEADPGVRLREALPRALVQACDLPRVGGSAGGRVFGGGGEDAAAWRQHARRLLEDAMAADRPGAQLPRWLASPSPTAPLHTALDAVLARKRIPCAQKLGQIEAMLGALEGKLPLTGAPMTPGVDVDGIFLMEKRDKSYLPKDRGWFNANGPEWQ